MKIEIESYPAYTFGMSHLSINARIHGRVQGVAFRHHTRKKAMDLGLTGWVKNLPDGTVALAAEGPPDALDALAEWIHHGPPFAHVTQVELVRSDTAAGHPTFDIVY